MSLVESRHNLLATDLTDWHWWT